MKHVRYYVTQSLRAMSIAVSLMASIVHADEYADVSQLVGAGKWVDALLKADQYLVGNPRDPQMRFLKGLIQRDSGKTAEAIGTFTRLTEDFPELPEPYNNLAVLYAGQSQFDKARTALEMAIRTNPSYAIAHENLGDVYAKLAGQAYSKALQLDTENRAVPPKLALIRELLTPQSSKTGKPATAPTLAPKLQDTGAANQEVESTEKAWAVARSSKNVNSDFGLYGKEFNPTDAQNRSVWEDERLSKIISSPTGTQGR